MPQDQKAIKVYPSTFWELKRMALEARVTLIQYVDFLVKSELARQRNPGVLIDTPVQYYAADTTGDVDPPGLYTPVNTTGGEHDHMPVPEAVKP